MKPYLFTICSTIPGEKYIYASGTAFKIYSAIVLHEKDYFLLNDECKKLTNSQKNKIKKINTLLLERGQDFFNLNLPLAFYYSVPDNSLPLLWQDGTEYSIDNNDIKKWYGLMPRKY